MRLLIFLILIINVTASFAQKGTKVKKQRINNNEMQVKFYEHNDLVQTGFYKDDLKNRSWVQYNSEGDVVALANFVDGQKHGKWQIKDDRGKVRYEIYYYFNRIRSAYQLDEHGALVAEIHNP